MPEEFEQLLNEASGNMELGEYRALLFEIESNIKDRLLTLYDEE